MADRATTRDSPKKLEWLQRGADNLVHEVVYGDAAGTKTATTYDHRRRVESAQTFRAALPGWPAPTDAQ